MHSEVVTDNVGAVLLGFIGWTSCRTAAAPLRTFHPDSNVGVHRLTRLILHEQEQRFSLSVNK